MPTKTLERARVMTPQYLKTWRQPIPRSWLNAAGILKGKKKINAIKYQQKIRQEWNG